MQRNRKSQRKGSLLLRGRLFSQKDLRIIRRCIRRHFRQGRTQISRAICEELDWRQPNGWLKDRACRDVLLQLEQKTLIKLPPPKVKPQSKGKKRKRGLTQSPTHYTTSPVTVFPNQIQFELAKGNKAEKIWNELVKQYHYLGHKVVVGRCIKYLIKTEDKFLGALAFSSPAWHLGPRDTILTEIGIGPDERHDLVINNSRFLILPNVQVPNLASTILSLAAERIVTDWTSYYSVTPLVVETFVQPSLYYGTCYKAANWVEVGLTKGYAKAGSAHRNSQEPKQIFLFGLNKKIRRKIARTIKSNGESNRHKEK
jgi:hypothetical protein